MDSDRMMEWLRVFQEYEAEMRRYAFKVKPCQNHVDHFVHETMLKVLSGTRTPGELENPRAYLYRVLKSMIVRWQSTISSRRQAETAWAESHAEVRAAEHEDSENERESKLDTMLTARLDEMPKGIRKTAVLFMECLHDTKEMMERTGLTARQTWRRVDRMWKWMREREMGRRTPKNPQR